MYHLGYFTSVRFTYLSITPPPCTHYTVCTCHFTNLLPFVLFIVGRSSKPRGWGNVCASKISLSSFWEQAQILGFPRFIVFLSTDCIFPPSKPTHFSALVVSVLAFFGFSLNLHDVARYFRMLRWCHFWGVYLLPCFVLFESNETKKNKAAWLFAILDISRGAIQEPLNKHVR